MNRWNIENVRPTREWLERAYITEWKPIGAIAAELGVSDFPVRRWLKEYGIPLQPWSLLPRSNWQSEEWLAEAYERHGRSANAIAKELGVTQPTVVRYLRLFGIQTRTRSEWSEKAQWKGKFSLPLFERWSPSMAWLIGYAFADGCVRHNKLTYTSIDLDLLETVAQCVAYEGRIASEYREDGNLKRHILVLSDKKLPGILERYNLTPRKSLTIEMPPEIPRDCIGPFVRGVFDGDGCAYIRNNGATQGLVLTFASGSLAFIQGLHRVIQETCGARRAVYSRTPRMHVLTCNNILDNIRVLDLMYRGSAGLCLKRKHDKADEYMRFLSNASARTLRWSRWTPEECEYVKRLIAEWPTIDHPLQEAA